MDAEIQLADMLLDIVDIKTLITGKVLSISQRNETMLVRAG
jgi:hypothetical protein